MCAILLIISLVSVIAAAEQSESFGNYTVHYNALTTDLIDPAVARNVGIIRSKSRALINVAVLRKVMGTPSQPVKAEVKITATNLNSQLKTIEIRELREEDKARGTTAIYYIGEVPVDHTETLIFHITIKPEGETETHELSFQEQFFTR